MNKMTKGALATGLGVALLVGGGGTLAVWNAEATKTAGTIVAGNMTLDAGEGKWTNVNGKDVDLAEYKVVPGDVLTFTQPVTVGMTGDLLEAALTTTGLARKDTGYFTVGATELTDKSYNAVVNPLTSATNKEKEGAYIAKVSVTFDSDIKVNNESKNASRVLGALNFQLDQTKSASGTAAASQ
jgi:alternate signal-mediated exported protein